MTQTAQQFYEFGSFRVDAAKRLLLRNGDVVPLTPKAFDILLALVEDSGQVVEKPVLMTRVWPDSFVEEGNLTYNISILRKALGERPDEHQYIVTVPGRGYRFVATVSEANGENIHRAANQPEHSGLVVEAPKPSGGSEETKQQQALVSTDSLISKVKNHKTGTLAVVAALVVIIAAPLSLFIVSREPESTQRISIAVVDFVNETSEPELNGLSGMLITSLEQSRRLSVLTRSRLFDILKNMGKPDADHIDESLGREVCNRANVSALVIASVRKFDQLYTIDLKVLDPQENQYIFTAQEVGESKASIPGMIDRLSERARSELKERTAGIQTTNKKIADVTTTNLEAYRHYFLGEQLHSKNKNDEAAEEFKKAIGLDPTFALAHYQLAYMIAWHNPELSKGPIQKAMGLIDRAPEKERHMIRAVSAFAEGNPREAITISEEALNLYPSDKDALWMVGDLSFHLGDYATAITHMEKILELDPQFEPARGHLLWVFKESGSYDRMLQYATRYIEESPNEDVYVDLVEAHALQRDFDSAIHASRRFREAFPKGWLAVWAAGQTYLLKNEFEEAEAEASKLLDASSPLLNRGEGYRMLADSFVYQGKYRDAVNATDHAIEIALKEGNRRDLAFNYAKKAYCLVIGHNDTRKARQALDEAIELNAGTALAYQLAFYSYLTMGEYEKASPIVTSNLAALGPVGDVVVSGYAHRANREYEAAITDFQTVAERGFTVNRMLAGYQLALCYFDTEQYEKAIEAVSKMQKLYAFGLRANQYRAAVYPRVAYLLGRIYEDKQDKKLAVENYLTFLDLWKNADRDLPELIDAESRLASLRGTPIRHQRNSKRINTKNK